MNYIYDNISEILIISAIFMLVVDALILGFSSLFLTFFAGGFILSAIIFYLNIIPIEISIDRIFIIVSICTIAFTLVSWKPLKAFQNNNKSKDVDTVSDLVGCTFRITEKIYPNTPINQKYSGVNWLVESESEIETGSLVIITKCRVGILYIETLQKR